MIGDEPHDIQPPILKSLLQEAYKHLIALSCYIYEAQGAASWIAPCRYSSRWYRPDTRVELTNWADVLAALPVPEHERRMLALELSRFPMQIERLPDIMQVQGVDHDITDFLTQSIDTQVRQLKALQPPESHHASSEPTYS